jgi:hypothetical protein
MTDKIREAFEKWANREFEGVAPAYCDDAYKAGYLAGRQSLLDELEPVGTVNSTGHPKHTSHVYGVYELRIYGEPVPVYRLPEGVTK